MLHFSDVSFFSVLSDIKREAQPSVLYLIKHDYKCFRPVLRRISNGPRTKLLAARCE